MNATPVNVATVEYNTNLHFTSTLQKLHVDILSWQKFF